MKEAGPKIVYDEKVLEPEIPYAISVDKEKLGTLLHELNISDEIIHKLVVNVRKVDPGERASSSSNTINIYGDDAWEEYAEASEEARGIVDGEAEPGDQFEGFLFTRKLPFYLRVAPRERAIAFADKLLHNALNREINSDLLHEMMHLADRSLGRYRIWYKFAAVFDALEWLERFDKQEQSAINFEKQMKNKPKWRNIVTIQPRE